MDLQTLNFVWTLVCLFILFTAYFIGRHHGRNGQ